MAHHVRGKLARELTSVRKAPEQLRSPAFIGDADYPEVYVGRVLNIFEVFARACDKEILSLKLRSLESCGDAAKDC